MTPPAKPDGALLDPGRQPPRTRLPALLGRVQAGRPPARQGRPGRGHWYPETLVEHPCVFATLTAPSFGPVHTQRTAKGRALPCRARRDRNERRCPHGRAPPTAATSLHPTPTPTRGSAARLPDCYDYTAAVLFNANAAELWRRFTTYLPRRLAALAGVTAAQLRPDTRSGMSRSPNTRPAASSTSTPSSASTPPATPTSRRPAATPPACSRTPSHKPPQPPTSRPTVAIGAARCCCASAPRPTPGPPPRPRRAAHRPGRRQLHRQVRHQEPRRARPARPADPQHRRHPSPHLQPPLPADDQHRLAARRHSARPMKASGCAGGRTCSATAATT